MYEFSEEQIILVQVRAPITKPAAFAASLMTWIQALGATKILILASANASWRRDDLLE